jgi:uncharacterized protein (DUF1778 family)
MAANARLDLRLEPHDKAFLESVALRAHTNLSQFIISAALERAREFILDRAKESGYVELGKKDMQSILAASGKPFKPNARLRKAMADAKRLVEHRE